MTSDPADPRNSEKTLGQLREERCADALDLEPSRLWKNDLADFADTTPKTRFWDGPSILAASISFVCGSVVGVPLGHYLHSIGF